MVTTVDNPVLNIWKLLRVNLKGSHHKERKIKKQKPLSSIFYMGEFYGSELCFHRTVNPLFPSKHLSPSSALSSPMAPIFGGVKTKFLTMAHEAPRDAVVPIILCPRLPLFSPSLTAPDTHTLDSCLFCQHTRHCFGFSSGWPLCLGGSSPRDPQA